MLTLNLMTPPKSIHGQPLRHVAHQADVVRLQALQRWGGIYMDMDSISLRPFKPLLAGHSAVMGKQDSPRGGTSRENSKYYGLCNAIMLSARNSPWVNMWLDAYKEFRSGGRDQHWDEHSVIWPANRYDELCGADGTSCPSVHGGKCQVVHALEPEFLFVPLWNTVQQDLFDSVGGASSRCANSRGGKCSLDDFRESFAFHLWATSDETDYGKLLKNLATSKTWFTETFYGELAQRHLQLRTEPRPNGFLFEPAPL